MRRLPLAYHCDRRWAEMDGDDVVRRCHDCARDVVNLSALDEDTARAMLDAQIVTACVRYDLDGGRIVFARRVRELAVAAAAAVLLAATPAGADATTPPPPQEQPPPAHAPRRHKRGNEKKRAQPKLTTDIENGGIILPPDFGR